MGQPGDFAVQQKPRVTAPARDMLAARSSCLQVPGLGEIDFGFFANKELS